MGSVFGWQERANALKETQMWIIPAEAHNKELEMGFKKNIGGRLLLPDAVDTNYK